MKIFLLWYDNGIDYQRLLSAWTTQRKAEDELKRCLDLSADDYNYLTPSTGVIEKMELQ